MSSEGCSSQQALICDVNGGSASGTLASSRSAARQGWTGRACEIVDCSIDVWWKSDSAIHPYSRPSRHPDDAPIAAPSRPSHSTPSNLTNMTSKMWEVDPETRSKLLTISKTNENNKCVDCGAPSPQWVHPLPHPSHKNPTRLTTLGTGLPQIRHLLLPRLLRHPPQPRRAHLLRAQRNHGRLQDRRSQTHGVRRE